MTVLYTNNAATTLAATISNSATSMSVASGAGALFPSPEAGDFFYMTLVDSGGSIEIVKVTARTNDTMTIVRAQDGTTALAFASGSKAELRITKAMLDQLKLDVAALGLIGSTTAFDSNSYTGGIVTLGVNAAATEVHSSALGFNSTSVASSVAVGSYASAGSSNSVAIGVSAAVANIYASNSVALGNGATVGGESGVAIGYLAQTAAINAIVISAAGSAVTAVTPGFFVKPVRDNQQGQTSAGTLQYDSTTGEIFYGASTSGGGLIGTTTDDSAGNFGETALGYAASAGGASGALNGVAIGIGASIGPLVMNGVAVGSSSNVSSSYGIAIGMSAYVAASAENSISIGANSTAQAAHAIVINAEATSLAGNADGFYVKPVRADGSGQIASGTLKYDQNTGEIFYSSGSGGGGLFGVTDGSTYGSVALGLNATVTTDTSAVAIGTTSSAGTDSTAVGFNASNANGDGVAIGSAASASIGGIALGKASSAIGWYGIAIGLNSTAAGYRSLAIGASVYAPENSVYLQGADIPAGSNMIAPSEAGFYVWPVRSSNTDPITSNPIYRSNPAYPLKFDTVTSEIYYDVNGGGLIGSTTFFDFSAGTFGETVLGAFSSVQSAALYGIAIGYSAGVGMQVVSGIAVGNSAFSGASGGIAIGSSANVAGGSDNSIVIGTGTTYVPSTIVLNAEAGPLVTFSSGLYVKPVRENTAGQTSAGGLSYDMTTGEIYSDDNLTAERGTFTPILKGTTAGADISGTGYYRRVGKQVTVHIEFQNVSTSGHNGTTRISGLPFTIAGYYSQTGHAKVYSWGTLSSNKVMAFFDAGNTYVDLYTQDTNGNWSALAISAGASRYVVVDGTYMID